MPTLTYLDKVVIKTAPRFRVRVFVSLGRRHLLKLQTSVFDS